MKDLSYRVDVLLPRMEDDQFAVAVKMLEDFDGELQRWIENDLATVLGKLGHGVRVKVEET